MLFSLYSFRFMWDFIVYSEGEFTSIRISMAAIQAHMLYTCSML